MRLCPAAATIEQTCGSRWMNGSLTTRKRNPSRQPGAGGVLSSAGMMSRGSAGTGGTVRPSREISDRCHRDQNRPQLRLHVVPSSGRQSGSGSAYSAERALHIRGLAIQA